MLSAKENLKVSGEAHLSTCMHGDNLVHFGIIYIITSARLGKVFSIHLFSIDSSLDHILFIKLSAESPGTRLELPS